MNKKTFDVLILGGGASGLACAIKAKQLKPRLNIAIIEKNDRVGKKLLSTGNGRCNLTNKYVSADRYYGSFADKTDFLLNKYSTEKVLDFFYELGLTTFGDNEGRYYPVCKQASAVLDVMRFACERLGIEIFCSENVKSIKQSKGLIEVITDNCNFTSKKLVVACGSKAAPKLGGNASATDYLKNFGHKFVPFSPALCPVKVKSNIIKSLKGIRVTGKASLVDKNNKLIKSECGEIQFTDTSLSGICIFNLSVYMQKDCHILLDLANNYSFKELLMMTEKHKILFENYTIDNLFTGVFQKRVTQAVLKMCGINDFARLCSSLTANEIKLIVNIIKNMTFEVVSNEDFAHAQCTTGGVTGSQINEKTMESKLVKGLFICGEAIDICGECGGFNLHFAFASGCVAGENL